MCISRTPPAGIWVSFILSRSIFSRRREKRHDVCCVFCAAACPTAEQERWPVALAMNGCCRFLVNILLLRMLRTLSREPLKSSRCFTLTPYLPVFRRMETEALAAICFLLSSIWPPHLAIDRAAHRTDGRNIIFVFYTIPTIDRLRQDSPKTT